MASLISIRIIPQISFRNRWRLISENPTIAMAMRLSRCIAWKGRKTIKARATIEREVIYVSGVLKVRAAKPLSGKRARCWEEVEWAIRQGKREEREREESQGWNDAPIAVCDGGVSSSSFWFPGGITDPRGTYRAHYEMWRTVSRANKFSSSEYIRQHVSRKKPSFAPRQ